MDRGWPHNFEIRIAIRRKNSQEKSSAPETKQQGRKRNIAFRDTVQALSVYYKRNFNVKV